MGGVVLPVMPLTTHNASPPTMQLIAPASVVEGLLEGMLYPEEPMVKSGDGEFCIHG